MPNVAFFVIQPKVSIQKINSLLKDSIW